MVSYTIGAAVLLGLILTATETSAQDDRYIVKDKESTTSDAAIGAHLGEFTAISAATDEDHGSRYLRSSDRGMSHDKNNRRRRRLQEESILDILNGIPGLSVLAMAVDAAGLDGVLSGDGPFTVFGK